MIDADEEVGEEEQWVFALTEKTDLGPWTMLVMQDWLESVLEVKCLGMEEHVSSAMKRQLAMKMKLRRTLGSMELDWVNSVIMLVKGEKTAYNITEMNGKYCRANIPEEALVNIDFDSSTPAFGCSASP